ALAAAQRGTRLRRNAERGKPAGIEMPLRLPLEAEPYAFRLPMAHREAANGEIAFVERRPGSERVEGDREGRMSSRPQGEEVTLDDGERLATAGDDKLGAGADQPQGRDEAAQPEHVVEMGMRQQHA